jgi:oligopeptide/dipeptide ABC transporter ATP-binding protein
LYRGQVVEAGSVREVSGSPRHPYTRALIAAAPVPDPGVQRARGVARRHAVVEREVPDARPNREACAFAPRCPYVVDRCRREKPNLRVGSSGALVACHLEEQLPEVAVLFGRPRDGGNAFDQDPESGDGQLVRPSGPR